MWCRWAAQGICCRGAVIKQQLSHGNDSFSCPAAIRCSTFASLVLALPSCLPFAQDMNVLGMQGRGRERHPGVITSALAPSKCISCGQCAVVCPVRQGWGLQAATCCAVHEMPLYASLSLPPARLPSFLVTAALLSLPRPPLPRRWAPLQSAASGGRWPMSWTHSARQGVGRGAWARVRQGSGLEIVGRELEMANGRAW